MNFNGRATFDNDYTLSALSYKPTVTNTSHFHATDSSSVKFVYACAQRSKRDVFVCA